MACMGVTGVMKSTTSTLETQPDLLPLDNYVMWYARLVCYRLKNNDLLKLPGFGESFKLRN